MICYHTTKQNNIQSIQERGLLPDYKNINKRRVHDPRNCIFLCDKKSIPFWMILLNHNTVFEVQIPDTPNPNTFNYTDYMEYTYRHPIPNTQIKQIKPATKEELKQANLNLCENTIISLCFLTSRFIDYYHRHGKEDKTKFYEYAKPSLRSIQTAAKQIDFTQLSDEKIKTILQNFGNNGEYTFCDTYQNTQVRLW